MPKLSIITINLNNVNGLNRTLKSVISQIASDFEYIVVDGASTDNSVKVIVEFENQFILHINKFRWVSEPDSGIFNAMNKGIRMATGDYLLFLNSGDWLASSNVIESILPYLNNDLEIISGELMLVKNSSECIKLLPPARVSLSYCINKGLTHPNTFIRRELFEKYGYYNEQNNIISDWEFFLIVCGLNSCKYLGISVLISYFTLDGISVHNEALLKQETKDSLKRLLPWWKKIERFIRRK
jgi:glycosyltransferase involved in cell wall biosynthesis